MKKLFIFFSIILCAYFSSAQVQLVPQDTIATFFNYETPDSIYRGTTPVIIDFYADWCGPCRMLAPILTDLSQQYQGQILFYKVNIDHNRKIAKKLNIQSIPTLLFLKPNKNGLLLIGYRTKDQLDEIIKKYLLSPIDK